MALRKLQTEHPTIEAVQCDITAGPNVLALEGAGGMSLFPRMWQRMQSIVDGCVVVSLDETRAAMRILAEKTRIVSEGAGALPLAALLGGKIGEAAVRGPIVAVISGGNIDLPKFIALTGI